MKLRLAVVLLLFFPSALFAQVGIYGTFTASKANAESFQSDRWLRGGDLGVYFNSYHFVVANAGLDIRAMRVSQSQQTNLVSDQISGAFVGPRIELRPHVINLKPYAAAELGAAKVRSGGVPHTSAEFKDQNGFAYQLNVGADLGLLPHLDVRVIEFSYTGFPTIKNPETNSSVNAKSLSVGVVFRL